MKGFTCLQVIRANGRLCLEGGVAHSRWLRLKAYLQMLGVSPAQPYKRYPDHGILNDTSAMEHAGRSESQCKVSSTIEVQDARS